MVSDYGEGPWVSPIQHPNGQSSRAGSQASSTHHPGPSTAVRPMGLHSLAEASGLQGVLWTPLPPSQGREA